MRSDRALGVHYTNPGAKFTILVINNENFHNKSKVGRQQYISRHIDHLARGVCPALGYIFHKQRLLKNKKLYLGLIQTGNVAGSLWCHYFWSSGAMVWIWDCAQESQCSYCRRPSPAPDQSLWPKHLCSLSRTEWSISVHYVGQLYGHEWGR